MKRNSFYLVCISAVLLLSCQKQVKELGLIGYWKFDTIENGLIKDMSNNGLDGKVVNFSLTNGKFGKAMAGNGQGYLAIEWKPITDSLKNGLTICAWVNRDTSKIWNCIITREIGSGWSEYFDIGVFQDQALFSIDPGGKDHFTKISQIEPFPVHTWIHLAGVYDNKKMKFFVNGVMVRDTTFNLPINVEDKNPIVIGGNTNDNGKTWHDFFYGKIDEVKFFNRPLSNAEILKLYSSN